MLFPACDRCGQCGCSCGTLPYTLTVQWSGLVNKTHSAHCPLTITSDFGCGAAGVGMSPGGCPDNEPDCGASDAGPLTEVLLTDGGHGYAKTGRVQPTITISGGGGTGATFTPTLVAIDDTLAEQCRSYKLASVAVEGGTGYINGKSLTIETNGKTVTKAVALVVTNASRVQPTVTASVTGVSGESLSVTLKSNGDAPETWGVEAVSVTTAGSGWSSNEWTLPVTFATSATKVTDATATATKQVVSPGAEYSYTNGGGTGFSGTVTLASQTCDDGYPCYTPTSISITSGGTGYSVGDVIEFISVGRDPGNGGTEGVAEYTVESVAGSGKVTGLSEPNVIEPFRKFTGGVGSITVDTKGAYYALSNGGSGAPASVTVTNPGEYYKEDQSAPACVANVTVDASACGGTDAAIAATIDDDPTSDTFGEITDLTVDDGGDGYLCWLWICEGLSAVNGEDIVVTATNPKKLVTIGINACHGSGACIEVVPVGEEITCGKSTFNKAYSGGLTPIRQITLTSGGSNYAKRGREVPQWTAVSYGYTFTPTFGEQDEDACGLPWWPVESFAITSGSGSTQLDGWALQHGSLLQSPEFLLRGFSATVHTRQQPTVTAAVAGSGSGATLTVTLAASDGFPKQWSVASVTSSGGTGYSNQAAVTFSVPARAGNFGHYTGQPASGFVTVDNDGSITGVTITGGGSYWLDNGIPQAVRVVRGGQYYRENDALPPYVATVNVSVDQLPPSSGSGAQISATVNSTVGHADFGRITAATLVSKGSGYTLLGGPMDCTYSTSSGECASIATSVTLRGANRPPDVSLGSFLGANVVARADDPLDDCGSFPGSATLLYGAPAGVTATITSGGEIVTECTPPAWCKPCSCPTDFITGDKNVSVTSDIQCGDGNAGYDGPIGDFNFDCSWTDPATNITYESDLMLVFECCDEQKARCDDDGPCEYLLKGRLYGALYLPEDPDGAGDLAAGANSINIDSDGGCDDLITVNTETGAVSGTVTFTVGGSTVTVTFAP